MSGELDIDFTRRNKKPRPLSDHEKEKLDEFVDAIHYSARWVVNTRGGQRVFFIDREHRYSDDAYEYRHVQLPKQMLKAIPKDYFDGARGTLKLLWEEEWRALGITQSLGWEHYEVHEPEPHILLFKYVVSEQTPRAAS
ncbi:hypothetical protein J4E85_008839 [Alternaria conjuncta]|uniref:uncharacterized protein n=1 Tax=Alternaria conjuncta TaxID=181017 RepID=UPI00221EA1B9|nr:uncharacterized protein J4E85_008839 [Alternaria conjuncta]KAI4921494.1 hypothetical protein J4E85_008839 [Alternaria conjuncta]